MSRGDRLRALLIVAASTVLVGAPAHADVDVDGTDGAPPVAVAVAVGPGSVDVTDGPATVTLTVRATDDVSGVASVSPYLLDEASGVRYGWEARNVPATGDRYDGIWQSVVEIPAHAPAGTYRLRCTASDNVSRNAVCTGGAVALTVLNSASDTAAPVATALAPSPDTVDVTDGPASVTLAVRATDDVAGVASVSPYLLHEASGVRYGWEARNVPATGDRYDGTWQSVVQVPRHAPPGAYRIRCTISDKVSRNAQCTGAATLLVVDRAPDGAAPVLGALSAAPATVDVTHGPATVTVSVRATDDVSGVASVSPTLVNDASGVRYGWEALQRPTTGDRLDGTWQASIVVPRYAPTGTYRLRCTANDNVSRNASCTGSAVVTVDDRSVDLVTTLTATGTPVKRGASALLRATVTNKGPATPEAPVLAWPVPGGTTVVSLPAGCSSADDLITCDLPADALAPGRSVQREVELRRSTTASGPITATAVASSSSTERTPADNTASLELTVDDEDPQPPAGDARLSLTSGVAPVEALPGDIVTYTQTATNAAGAGPATGTVVTQVLPAGVTFLDASSGCTYGDGAVRCELGTVPAGGSRTATVRATVDPLPMRTDPNTAHQVLEQKAETDLRVERGETRTATATCPSGYVATDGGVRLDAVDQVGSAARTSVPRSGPTADGTGWTATLGNDNPGAALAKVTVACLARTTVTGSHQHDVVSTAAPTVHATVAAGDTSVVVDCAPGQTPFAPAYDLTTGAVTTSRASGSGWTFVVAATEAGAGDFSVRCLDRRTTSAGGHYHLLGVEQREQTVTVPAGTTIETQLTCAAEAKGIVASRELDAGLVDRGTDPRAKIRSFRLTNPTDQALDAHLGLTCLDIRTSAEPVSARITSAAAVTTTAPDATTGDDAGSATFTAYGEGWAILPTSSAVVAPNGRSVAIPVRCAADCVVAARLIGGRGTLATGSARIAGADTGRLTVRATAAGAKVLRSTGLRSAVLRVTTSEGATYSRSVRLRR